MASVNYGKHILESVIMTNVVMVSVNYGKHILASVIMTNVVKASVNHGKHILASVIMTNLFMAKVLMYRSPTYQFKCSIIWRGVGCKSEGWRGRKVH